MTFRKFITDAFIAIRDITFPQGAFSLPKLAAALVFGLWGFGALGVIIRFVYDKSSDYLWHQDFLAVSDKLRSIDSTLDRAPKRGHYCTPHEESGYVYLTQNREPLAVERCSIDGYIQLVTYYIDGAEIGEDEYNYNERVVWHIIRRYISGEKILAIDTLDHEKNLISRLDCFSTTCEIKPHGNFLAQPPPPSLIPGGY